MVNSYIGVCRFCGQQAILEIDKEEWDMLNGDGSEDAWRKYLDEKAVKQCTCTGARSHNNVEKRIARAEQRCMDVAENEELGTILKDSIRPIMMEKIEKLTVRQNGTSYMTYLDGDEQLHVRKEKKVVDDNKE